MPRPRGLLLGLALALALALLAGRAARAHTPPPIYVAVAVDDEHLVWELTLAAGIFEEWFDSMNITDYQFVKRMALSKEKDLLREILEGA